MNGLIDELCDVLVMDVVVDISSQPIRSHKAKIPKHFELMRQCRLLNVKLVNELAHIHGLVPQNTENLNSNGMSESVHELRDFVRRISIDVAG